MTEAQPTSTHPVVCGAPGCGQANPPGSIVCRKCGADIVAGRGMRDALMAVAFFALLTLATFLTVRMVMRHYDAKVRAQAEKAGVLEQIVDKPEMRYPDIPGTTPPPKTP